MAVDLLGAAAAVAEANPLADPLVAASGLLT